MSTTGNPGGGEGGSTRPRPIQLIHVNPFYFLNSYIDNLQLTGTDIQLVFNSPGGGGVEEQIAETDENLLPPPPASRSAVEGLPDVKITREILASDSSQCAVCADTFELNEEVKQMPCNHIYHKSCILPWLQLRNSCPVCRHQLPTDDEDYEIQRINLGLRAPGGSQENRDDNSNSARSERNISTSEETSSSGGNRGSGAGSDQAREETSSSGGNRGSEAGADQAREENIEDID